MKLDKTLNFKKVRCVKGYDDCLEVGKEYNVIDISVDIKVKDDEGELLYWESDHFEPVLEPVVNQLQNMELPTEFETEASEPKFKVGDKVYKYGETDVKTVLEVFEDGYMRISNYPHRVNNEVICHATPENHALLSKPFPAIEFEAVEPVLADNSVNIQDIGTDILDTNADIKDTPEFKVGDKVYFGANPDIKTISEVGDDNDVQFVGELGWASGDCCCHATQENYERLQATFPGIEFEAPPKPLTGIELAKKMIAKGHNYLVVDTVIGIRVLTRLEGNTLIDSNNVRLDELDDITPLNDETGEPLTESVLND